MLREHLWCNEQTGVFQVQPNALIFAFFLFGLFAFYTSLVFFFVYFLVSIRIIAQGLLLVPHFGITPECAQEII